MGIVSASIASDFWNDQLVAHGRQWVFLVFVGFVGSFAFIRMSTRIQRSPRVKWWPGSVVSEGGVHVHHLVFGFFVFPLAAYGAIRLGKPGSPWAKRFYGERNPTKQAQAESRFRPDRRTERFKERFRDVIGGETTMDHQARLTKRADRDDPDA